MAKPRMLPASFFDRPAPVVARELIGKILAREFRDEVWRFMITETEAYEGPEDQASHASRGRTARTEVMFGAPGTLYVYLIYGIHNMLNIVTGRREHPAAVLIRGVKDIIGPGNVTKALAITTKRFNKKMIGEETGLWIEDAPSIPDEQIENTPRIGVSYAGEEWARKPYRFAWKRPRSS